MSKGNMSPEADQRFEDVWSQYYGLRGDSNKLDNLYTTLAEAARERSNRSTTLRGNLYAPVWVILVFGFIALIYSLYFINREPTAVSIGYEFMVIFLVLSCIYFIYELDTPFSGLIILTPDALQIIHLKMVSLG